MSTALVTHADWLGQPPLYFWECPECACEFGPLYSDRAVVEQQAIEHDTENHAEASA